MNEKDFDPFLGKSEEERRKMHEFAEKYFAIRKEMKRLEEEAEIYEAIRKKFVERLISEVRSLSVDFYPEYERHFPLINDDLTFIAETYFDDVTNLCDHYLEGKPGYFKQLCEPKFEIGTGFDRFKNQTDIPAYHEIMAVMAERFEEEYVEGFYFESYLKHIHLTTKRLFPEFVPEIYELPAQGFRELDGLLYIFQIEIFDLIREANPDDTISNPQT